MGPASPCEGRLSSSACASIPQAACRHNFVCWGLCRGIQGLAAAGTWAVGNAVVADVFPIEIRGQAFGIFMAPGVSRAGLATMT